MTVTGRAKISGTDRPARLRFDGVHASRAHWSVTVVVAHRLSRVGELPAMRHRVPPIHWASRATRPPTSPSHVHRWIGGPMDVTESSAPSVRSGAATASTRQPGRGRSASSPPASACRRRRGWLDRITVSTVIGLVAALLVFVLTAVLLRDRREMVTVAVASERIPAGDDDHASRWSRRWRCRRRCRSSTAWSGSTTWASRRWRRARCSRVRRCPARRWGRVTSTSGARVMAIPVESWQAAGGELDVGDQVDVIDTGDGGPALRVDRARRWSAGRPRTPAAGSSRRRTGRAVDRRRGDGGRGVGVGVGDRRRRVRVGAFDRRQPTSRRRRRRRRPVAPSSPPAASVPRPTSGGG